MKKILILIIACLSTFAYSKPKKISPDISVIDPDMAIIVTDIDGNGKRTGTKKVNVEPGIHKITCNVNCGAGYAGNVKTVIYSEAGKSFDLYLFLERSSNKFAIVQKSHPYIREEFEKPVETKSTEKKIPILADFPTDRKFTILTSAEIWTDFSDKDFFNRRFLSIAEEQEADAIVKPVFFDYCAYCLMIKFTD